MINLTGKNVFVKTQEEYLGVLKIAKLQGFTWGAKKRFKPYRNSISEHIELLQQQGCYLQRQ